MTELDEQLIAAIRASDLARVQAALAAGADVHALADCALRWAAEGGCLEIVQYLLSAGANAKAGSGEALRHAASRGHLDIVRCLLRAGAPAHDGRALLWAAQDDRAGVVALLLQHGAPVTPSSAGGQILGNLHHYSVAMQVAFLSSAEKLDYAVDIYAHRGVCPEALCALLERQGHAELAAMLAATRMLSPLSPKERAQTLTSMLASHSQLEPDPYVS